MNSYEDLDFRHSNTLIRGGKNSRDVEKALSRIVIKALKLQNFNQRRITLGIYEGYLDKLQLSYTPEIYVNNLAKKIIPDNEAYNRKRALAYRWFKKDFADEIDKLFTLLLAISNENE